MHHLDEKDIVQDGDHQEVDKESKPIFENVEHLESLIEKCSRAPNVAIRHESALQLLQELTFENEEDNEIDADDEEDDGEYSCNNITSYVPLGDWLEKKKAPAIIIKQQFGFPMSTT